MGADYCYVGRRIDEGPAGREIRCVPRGVGVLHVSEEDEKIAAWWNSEQGHVKEVVETSDDAQL